MFFARLKSLTRTLRFRIAVWNAAVVLLTAIATLVALREGIRRTLLDEVDKILLEDMHEVALAIPARNYPESTSLYDDLNRKAQAHQLHGWYVRFLDAAGDQIWASNGAPPKTPPMLTQRDNTPVKVGLFRVVQFQHVAPPALTIRVGSSLVNISSDMRRIDQQVAIVAIGLLLIAPLCGYWLAGRATRPLADIIHTTARLRPTRLDERLPIRRTGDELDQLAHTVNALLDRIAHYLGQKRDFLANAAHELRTPLAALRSSIEVASDGNRPPEEYEQLLGDLIEECATLEVLVNQLLLLAETEADTLQIHGEAVAWDKIVAKSLEMFQPVAEFKGLELVAEIAGQILVEGNRHHLRQVLNNLLDNAIKYTPPGGSIHIRLEPDEAARHAVLVVRDTGVGIHPHEVGHVFERFFRSDKARQREAGTRGTGLGLSICEAVVHSHGGHISVSSEVGRGTTFTVTLPLAPTHTTAAP